MQDWEARLHQLSLRADLQSEIIGFDQSGTVDHPLYALTRGDPNLPAVLVAAGVHGDEPEGVEAALRLLEGEGHIAETLRHSRLVVLPCLNPSGFVLETRTNGAGQDINRQFHIDLTETTTAVRLFLSSLSVRLLVDLHTDSMAGGFYFFELRQREAKSLAPAVQAAVTKAGFALEEKPFYAGMVGKRGLLAPTEKQIKTFERATVGASLAQWGWRTGIPRCYVFETPAGLGGMGVLRHLTALRALFVALEETRG